MRKLWNGTLPVNDDAWGFGGAVAGNALVQHGAERPNVGTFVELSYAGELLGSHVRRSPDDPPQIRDRVLWRLESAVEQSTLPEVEDPNVRDFGAFGQKHLLRIEIAVNGTGGMRRADDRHDVGHDEPRDWPQSALATLDAREGFSVQHFHDEDGGAIVQLEQFVNLDDTGMLDCPGELCGARKPPLRVCDRKQLPGDLQGYALTAHSMPGFPHISGATAPEKSNEHVRSDVRPRCRCESVGATCGACAIGHQRDVLHPRIDRVQTAPSRIVFKRIRRRVFHSADDWNPDG